MAETFDPYRKWLGIPADEQPPNHYRLLGVPLLEEDPEVIENAAHRQMAYVRTFQSGPHSAESQKLLNELAAAKVCLLHHEKKAAYDETLRPQLAEPPPVPTAPPDAPVVFTKRRSDSAATSKRSVAHEARRRGPSRQSLLWAPVLSGLGGVALIVVLVSTYTSSRKQHSGPTTGSAKASASPGEDSPFGQRTPRTSFAPPRSNSPRSPAIPSSLVKSQGKPNTSDAGSTASGAAEPRTPDRDERLRQQLKTVRESLGRRDMSRLPSLAGVTNRPLRQAQLKEEVEQLQAVGRYLDEFWKAANRGLSTVKRDLSDAEPKKDAKDTKEGTPPAGEKRSEPATVDGAVEEQPAAPATSPAEEETSSDATSPAKPAQSVHLEFFDHTLEIVEVQGDKITRRVGGETRTAKLWELSSLDAAALAWHSLKKDDVFGRVYVAVFLCIDKQGDAGTNVAYAQKIATGLADHGETSFPYLERELRRTLPGSDGAGSPVAATNPPTPPDSP